MTRATSFLMMRVTNFFRGKLSSLASTPRRDAWRWLESVGRRFAALYVPLQVSKRCVKYQANQRLVRPRWDLRESVCEIVREGERVCQSERKWV